MTTHLQAEFIYKYLHMFLECISFKTEILMVRWNTRIRRKITPLGNSWAWTMVIPAKTSGVVFLFPYVLWMWLWHLWAWWSRTEDNWCWIEEPYFLLWQLAIFVTLIELNTIKVQSLISPSSWMSEQVMKYAVHLLGHVQAGRVWLLLLFEMMLCLSCGPKLWSATWCLLSSTELSCLKTWQIG